MKLGLAVSSATARGVADSGVLRAAADAAGIRTRLIDWRSAEWDWADAVLLHAPWDYTDDVAAFDRWLQDLSARLPVHNDHAGVAGNTHKSYLVELARAGIPVPLTRVLRAGSAVDALELSEAFRGAEVVVKPAVGAGGRGLHRLRGVADLESSPLLGEGAVPVRDVLVQEFLPSVVTAGERSLVVIAGEPSHLVLKTPRAGDFRVQHTYGGAEHRVELDDTAMTVWGLLRSRVQGLTYARIDYALDGGGHPVVMELELTEPDLFLRHAPEAAGALVRRVQGGAG